MTEPVDIDVGEQARLVPRGSGLHAPGSDLPLLALGVMCASAAGPLVAATTAPALAIAFWRNGLGTLVVLPYALLRCGRELVRIPPRSLCLALFAGVLLAVHFGTYVPSLRYTSVASAAALVCSQSVWAAVFARILGQRLPPTAVAGIAVALAGVLFVTGVDMSLASDALFGDLLAMLGGVFGGAYMVTGGQVRRHVSTTLYTAICYGCCALLLLLVCLLTGQQLSGYSARDWGMIVAITALAQLLGHSMFNLVLRSTSPTVVSLATLFTVPLSTVLAALIVGQMPPLAALPALALLVVGIGMVIWARDRPVS
ncbi:MAG: DMT family transporter [Nocardioidaceae bacterium]